MDLAARAEGFVQRVERGERCKRLTELSAKCGHEQRRLLPHRFGRHEFILTFPHQIRRWLLGSPESFSEVIRAVVGEISRLYVTYSHQTFGKKGHYLPTARSVTFIQLFGASLAANPHLHMMFLDGVDARSNSGPRF